MVQAIPANQATLGQLKAAFGLQQVDDPAFFPEWATSTTALSDQERQALDRVKANFTTLWETPPLLENTVKMVVLAPLLDLAGFYRPPYRLETETGLTLEMADGNQVIRGRVDVLVLQGRLWLLVVESKRSDFAVTVAVPQALAYMLATPSPARPTFGLITNGSEFLFLKALRQPRAEYANSRLFSLFNPGNELYPVLQVLQRLGPIAVGAH